MSGNLNIFQLSTTNFYNFLVNSTIIIYPIQLQGSCITNCLYYVMIPCDEFVHIAASGCSLTPLFTGFNLTIPYTLNSSLSLVGAQYCYVMS